MKRLGYLARLGAAGKQIAVHKKDIEATKAVMSLEQKLTEDSGAAYASLTS